MPKRIAVFGGSFNPPGIHHLTVARTLSAHFDELVIVPCGPRPDKPVTNDVPPIYRAAMADMTFSGLERVRVDLFDLEASTFTRTHQLEERYAPEGEVWHVIGADLLEGGHDGQSFIQREWDQGERIWREFRFAVVKRPGFDLTNADLPPHHDVFEIHVDGSSSRIRNAIFHHHPVTDLVAPQVERYIERHRLYSGMRPQRRALVELDEIRPLVIVDEENPDALAAGETLTPCPERPNVIIVIGGDGTMLRAIRSEWRRRIPFCGFNMGHVGFLLNDTPLDVCLGQRLSLEQLPLLWAQTIAPDGSHREALAFNDAWVERATGQTAWLRVSINGRERLPQLVADGALISTAAGSTSYARAMGAHPLPLNSRAMMLVGSNVLRPDFWKPVVLPIDAVIELKNLDPDKRPLSGYIDGVPQGPVASMTARVSNIAAVELLFDPSHDLAEKLSAIQFPP